MICCHQWALRLVLVSGTILDVSPAFGSDVPEFPAGVCAEELNRSEVIPESLYPASEAQVSRVSYIGNAAVLLEYPSVYDVHSALDPDRDIRSQGGSFLEELILEDLEPYVNASAYDFVLMYSLQELPGWIHSGSQWHGAPAKNIGQRNSNYGNGRAAGAWTRLRGTPHMNAIDLFDGWELFPGSDAGTLVPIHEMGHYWMVNWSRSSPGPREWRPGDPLAHLAGAAYHWSWNWIDAIPGPEHMPGIMYSAPLSYSFNEFDLYAMGLMDYSEVSGVSHTIYECAPPNYESCNPGDEHELMVGHLVDSLELEGPNYFEGDGLRIPATDATVQDINTLLVVIKGEDETLSPQQAELISTIGTSLPGAWNTATRVRSRMSTRIRHAGMNINPGLNDAWYNDATNGQGFFITVFEERGIVFLAWFTYDIERPPTEVTALLGEPGHRWLTAQGPYTGDTAVLDVYLTEGGVFGLPEPVPETGDPIGTITIVWHDCEKATLSYEIDPPGVVGEIPLTRIVPDKVALCEQLGTK